MISPNPEIELHPAFFWMCEECGADNFIRQFTAVLSEEEISMIVQDYGEDILDMHLATIPLELTCSKCNAVFDQIRAIGDGSDN